MRTENINRKFKLHDERRIAAQLPEQLLGLDVLGFGKPDEFPGELLKAFTEFTTGTLTPHSRIYRNAAPNLVDAWLLDLLRQARIGDRFYLRTGLEYFPWADCRVLDHRWLESLRRVYGANQGFIANDKASAVMTSGAQYEVLGFLAGAGLPTAAPTVAAVPTAPPVVADEPTRRIVHTPPPVAPDQVTTVLSDDLRARRLAALAPGEQPAAAPSARPVSALVDAVAATPDLSAVPAQEAVAPTVVEVPAAPSEPAAATSAEAMPATRADEAPTQLISRIVVSVDQD